MTMVERVAWAMRSASEETDCPLTHDLCLPLARAAIKAMRDVDALSTPLVLIAGKEALFCCCEAPKFEHARKCWHAMIDEILK